ncbi:hypothetical protein BTA51_03545 [Hahella sp. CCB-MM4]|uniref:hypothetical protein n=1 Tax=Hahella sp. (strain CCB-MM4) TaxID=1926491 RepID=UPI000B9C3478|nr:hypothetical protein [Hahella sp. CCB-MM4]OZG75459.1 hypothetical protein BTA51_03545 [Hahella sp. CCB-MM4]
MMNEARKKLPISVVEYREFGRSSDTLLGEQEKEAVVDFITQDPRIGELIQNTGGMRKLAWPLSVKHKKEIKGTIYYFYKDRSMPIFMINVFKPTAKNTLARTIEILLQARG